MYVRSPSLVDGPSTLGPRSVMAKKRVTHWSDGASATPDPKEGTIDSLSISADWSKGTGTDSTSFGISGDVAGESLSA